MDSFDSRDATHQNPGHVDASPEDLDDAAPAALRPDDTAANSADTATDSDAASELHGPPMLLREIDDGPQRAGADAPLRPRSDESALQYVVKLARERWRSILIVLGWSVAIAAPVLLAWQFRTDTDDQVGDDESALFPAGLASESSGTSASTATNDNSDDATNGRPDEKTTSSESSRSEGAIAPRLPTDTSTGTARPSVAPSPTDQGPTTSESTDTSATTTTESPPPTQEPATTATATTATPTTATPITATPTTATPSTAPPPPTTVQADAAVFGFSLVSARNGRSLGGLSSGQEILLSDITQRPISVVASASDLTNSVLFQVGGRDVKLEQSAPWAIQGNGGRSYGPWNPGPGTHVITATPFTSQDGSGQPGAAGTVTISIVDDRNR